jgi:hypothetical protein
MSDTERSGFWRVENPIMWACLVTIAMFVALIRLGLSETCSENYWGLRICREKWRLLFNASPNEVGDTLAGFAGALAFVWIIVTVAMQSIELSEQRKVLTLQKDEMKLQRKATEDMAIAMAAQAEIFEGEKQQRQEEQARRELEQQLQWISDLTQREVEQGGSWMHDASAATYGVEPLRMFTVQKSPDLDSAIKLATADASKTIQELRKRQQEGFDARSGSREWYEFLQTQIDEALALEGRVSGDQKIRIRNMGLHRFSGSLKRFVEDDRFWSDIVDREPEYDS